MARFNPHPAFLPGDATARACGPSGQPVSIRTRHFCRVMPYNGGETRLHREVSIRTRHFCRVMREFLGGGNRGRGVSIRTRHFCRVMPGQSCGCRR